MKAWRVTIGRRKTRPDDQVQEHANLKEWEGNQEDVGPAFPSLLSPTLMFFYAPAHFTSLGITFG